MYSTQKSWLLSETHWFLSLFSGFQQLDLCSALKETLSVFSVSANWPAGQAAGLQQPAAAAVNIKWSQRASITSSLHLLFNIKRNMDKKTGERLRNGFHHSAVNSLIMSETLWTFNASVYSIICSTDILLWLWLPHADGWFSVKEFKRFLLLNF